MSVSPLSQPGNNAIKPEAPTGQTASAVAGTASNASGGATVSFTASTNPGKGSANYVATSSPGSVTASAASSPITFAAGSLVIGQAYTFTISKQSGSGVTSDASSATSPAVTAFTIPTAPTITVARQASQTLRITMTAAAAANGSTITSYQYRIKESGGSYGSYSALPGLTGPWDIGSLANGTTYFVQVRAVNGAGNGDGSNEPSAFPYTVPGTVSLSAVRQSSQTVRISWSAPSNGGSPITSYYYRYKVSSAGDNTYTAYTPTGATTVDIGSLTNGTQYTFQVYAENAAGAGGVGSASATPYAAPTVEINSVTNHNQDRATLNATASWGGDSTTITFQLSTDGVNWTTQPAGGTSGSIVGSPVSSDNAAVYMNLTGLSNGVLYYVRAQATNSAGTVTHGNTSFVTWSLRAKSYFAVGSHSHTVPTITPTGGSQIVPSIYNVAIVGGGGGCGAYSGGGGGQLKTAGSKTCANSNGSITVIVGAGGAAWEVSTQNPGDGGSSGITGLTSDIIAPGGVKGNPEASVSGVANTVYTRHNDGGASANDASVFLGGDFQYAFYSSGKSSIGYFGGGGGAGAGGHGTHGAVLAANPYTGVGGAGGAGGSAHQLHDVGRGGSGWGSQVVPAGTSGTGAGGDAANPQALISLGENGTSGGVTFYQFEQ